MRTAWFQFHDQLNDFLPETSRGRVLSYTFGNRPAIKDPIESFGVPHTEIELIVVDDESVGFEYRLRDGDRVAVYPTAEVGAPSRRVRLREAPPRRIAFVVDVNLGRLARYLRMCGFDAAYRNDYRDSDVARISAEEHRIALTRDRRLLHRKAIDHGYWVRSTNPMEQLQEVVTRFDLKPRFGPFRRCLDCNGHLSVVDKQSVIHELEPLTRKHYDTFFRCADCGKLYWPGSHYEHMRTRIDELLQ